MELTSKEFNKLTYIASGTFGSVYHDNNMAYKKYHKYIKEKHDFGYNLTYNPCLKQSIIRLKLMKYRSSKLIYNPFLTDILYIDKKFSGVCYHFHLGKTLNELKNLTYIDYCDIANQIIRNALELTEHNIYPLDYKQNNIIYTTKGIVKIIDLDDKLTKYTLIKNQLLLNKSIKILNKTLVYFLNANYEKIPKDTLKKFTNYNASLNNNSYEKIKKYVDERKKIKNFLFLNQDNIEQIFLIKKLIIEDAFFPVLLINYDMLMKKEYLNYIIEIYNLNGINFYDIVCEDINSFISAHNIKNILYLEKEKILTYKAK